MSMYIRTVRKEYAVRRSTMYRRYLPYIHTRIFVEYGTRIDVSGGPTDYSAALHFS